MQAMQVLSTALMQDMTEKKRSKNLNRTSTQQMKEIRRVEVVVIVLAPDPGWLLRLHCSCVTMILIVKLRKDMD